MGKSRRAPYMKKLMREYRKDLQTIYIPRNLHTALKLYAHSEDKTLQQAATDVMRYGFALLGFIELQNPPSPELQFVQMRLSRVRRNLGKAEVKAMREAMSKYNAQVNAEEEAFQEDILSLEESKEEEEKESIPEASVDIEDFEKFETEEKETEEEDEKVELKSGSGKELDQVLGRHLRNIIEESFKRSMDNMTPRINEILEKVTREIVSEIAESIIKKEIAKLKGGSSD